MAREIEEIWFNLILNNTSLRESWAPEWIKDVDFRYSVAQKYCKDAVVLDAGCGIGYGSGLLASTAKIVLGVDYSKSAIRCACESYKSSKVFFSIMDVRNLGFKANTFDRIVAIEVIEHFRESNIFLSEVKRVLKKDGVFLMSTPNKVFHKHDQKGLRYHFPYHVNLMGIKDLRKLLSGYFTSINILGIRRKKEWIYHLLRLLDFLNLRLFLNEGRRRKIKQVITIAQGNSSEREEIELKPVYYWNAHTFQGFFVICK